MGTSGNPSKKAAQRQISQIGDFKKRLGGIIELPSGAVVKYRNPGGMRVFISSGVIPNSLMSMIQKGLDSGKPMDANELVNPNTKQIDSELMNDMMQLMDNILVKVVVEPKVLPTLTEEDLDQYNAMVPEDERLENVEDLRDDEKLYADEFPDEDKMFLFQLVSGGVKDLEDFRRRHQSGVDAVAEVASAPRRSK